MSQVQGHPGLEVDHRANAPEVFPYYAPEVFKDPDHDTSKVAYSGSEGYYHDALDTERRVCGLRRQTFWIALIVATIVVVAAIGGGIGGALASKASRSSNDSSSSSNTDNVQPSNPPAASSSPSTTPTLSLQTLTNPTSLATLQRDCPSSDATLYSISGQFFRKICANSLRPDPSVKTNTNSVNKPTANLDECIALCVAYNVQNRTMIRSGRDAPCNNVCWRNTWDKELNDQPGGQCFGFESRNLTAAVGGGDGNATEWNLKVPAETRCDSAGMINLEAWLG